MSECRHGVDRDLECRECEDEYERQRKTSITKQKLGEAWAPFMDGKAAKEAQQEPAPGDIRALKYRIHELEGEVLGYKRLALERDKAAAVAHVGDMDHGPFEITPTAYGYDHLKHGDMLYTPPPPNHRAVMQQALDALEAAYSDDKPYLRKCCDAIAAIREVLP